ncbi:MAG: FecR domain-containing protein, partial [Chloroflexi bacterium]|nr:FecR domain-containing protein [Chloroflexota bacterium]
PRRFHPRGQEASSLRPGALASPVSSAGAGSPLRAAALLIPIILLAACVQSTPPALPPIATVSRPATAAILPTLLTPPSPAPTDGQAAITQILNIAQARPGPDTPWENANVGQRVPGGGEIQTLPLSTARIDITPGIIVRLAPETRLTLKSLDTHQTGQPPTFNLLLGQLWVILTQNLSADTTVNIDTPVGSASVNGSYLGLDYDPVSQTLIISCLEGRCRASNPYGTVALTTHQQTFIPAGNQPPAPPALTSLARSDILSRRDLCEQRAGFAAFAES